MLVDVKVIYEVPYRADAGRPGVDLGLRHGTFTVDVPYADEEIAPLAFSVSVHGIEYRIYRNRDGRLYEESRRLEEGGEGRPVAVFSTSRAAIVGPRHALAENAADVAVRSERQSLADKARAELSESLVERRDRWLLLRPSREPALVVVPPGGGGLIYRAGKQPAIRQVSADLVDVKSGEFRDALREDRAFRIDEMAEATERARDFGQRVNFGPYRFDVRDTSCLSVDLSSAALRLTGMEAIEASEEIRHPDVTAAARELRAVVEDPDANAAAMCPAARSFVASFGASRETTAVAAEPAIAAALDRLVRAQTRAQARMAANRIPDRDPRALAPEDDIVLGRLGM